MSRKAANEKFNWKEVNRFLRQRGVTLISAGLDEVPMAYKDIHEVMAAQNDLVKQDRSLFFKVSYAIQR